MLGQIGWWRTSHHKFLNCDELPPFTEGNNVLSKNKSTLELEKESIYVKYLSVDKVVIIPKPKKGVKNG